MVRAGTLHPGWADAGRCMHCLLGIHLLINDEMHVSRLQ